MTRKLLYFLGAVAVLGYYFYFTWMGLSFPFDNDDMYSIYLGWTKPWGDIVLALFTFWSSAFRPAGLLLYRGLFEVFGFHPLPFRIACMVLTIANMALCFWFVHLVSQSSRIAALALLLFAYQSRLMEVWVRTAIVYDILCFTFFYLGLCLYIEVRKRGELPGFGRSIAVLACYLAALDSKEMAVAFPVLLLAWEVLFNGKPRTLRTYWLIAVSGAMAALFILSKTHGGPASMMDPAFKPEYTLQRFEQNWNGRLTHLLLLTEDLRGHICLGILGAMLALAAVLRSRILLFAWTLFFVSAMPMIFIPPRGGYVLYIPYVGWTLFFATVLVLLQDMVLRYWPRARLALAVAVFVFVGWRYGKANLHDQRLDRVKTWLYGSPNAIAELQRDITRDHPTLPKKARLLFLTDGFQTDEWTPLFVLRLLYRDVDLTADRVKMMDQVPADWSRYQYLYQYNNKRYYLVTTPRRPGDPR